MSKSFAWLTCAVALLSSIASAEPTRLLGTDDVLDCALASDGRVLGATGGGLVVFDPSRGTKVLTALEGLPDTRVEAVRIDGNRAEVETRAGAARVDLNDLHVTAVPREATSPLVAVPNDAFRARAEHSSAGRRCVATEHGLLFGAGKAPLERLPLVGLPTGDVSAVASDGARLFVGTFDRGLFVATGTAIERVDFGVNPNINALAWDERARALWVGTARGVSRCEARPGAALACRRVGQNAAVHALTISATGVVIAGGDQGLTVFARAGTTEREFSAKQSAPFRAVWALSESEAGVLYVGTTSGLYFIKTTALRRAASDAPPTFERVSFVGGDLPDDWVTALATANGNVFAGTYNAGLATFREHLPERGQKLEAADFDTGLGYVNPFGIVPLPDGRLAVATMDGLRVGTPGNFTTLPTLGRDVTAIIPAATPDEYWIATRRGLERRRLPR